MRILVIMKNIAVAVLLLVWGCAGHEVSHSQQVAGKLQALCDEVSRVVPDEERRKKIQSAIDRCETELEAFTRGSGRRAEPRPTRRPGLGT